MSRRRWPRSWSAAQQVVVGGQQVEAVPLAGQHGPPQLALAMQRPGDALAVGSGRPVHRSGGRPAGPPRQRRPRVVDGPPQGRGVAPGRPRRSDPLTASAAWGGNADLRSTQPPQQVVQPEAGEGWPEGLRLLGVGQQGGLGQGPAEPVGLAQPEVSRGQGHQQPAVQLGHGHAELARLAHVGLQQRLYRTGVGPLRAGAAEPPGDGEIDPHLGEQQPGPGQRIELADAGEPVHVGWPALRGPWDVGVEQLGHMPAEHERRDDRVRGGIRAVGALGRCHGAPQLSFLGRWRPRRPGVCPVVRERSVCWPKPPCLARRGRRHRSALAGNRSDPRSTINQFTRRCWRTR